MKRFFGEKEGDFIKVSDDEYNHLKKILRMKEGDSIIGCVNDEYDYYCTIKKMESKVCYCHIDKIEKNLALPKKNIVLFQMLPKKEYVDNIIPKAVELGVSEIYFFTSSWTGQKYLNMERLKTQVKTACKQCERSKLVKVYEILDFDKMVELLGEFDIALFPFERESVLNKLEEKRLKNKDNICLVVGNEAGFTDLEAERIKSLKNVETFSLGNRILRCDTAVVSMLAIINHFTGN